MIDAPFTWTMLDTWIVVAAGLSAVSCALLGNFLVLRRMSMLGDAISHAVLPGLAIAFLITESRDSVSMLVGAAIVGVLTAVLTEVVHHLGRVEQSASMGVVFTTLFALGLVLIVRAAEHVDLDPGCVLYGSVETIVFATDRFSLFGVPIPTAVVTLAVVFLIDLVFVIVLFKELRISTFDPDLATTLGINARLMHYLLMSLVAMTTVACFEAVGSILVIAMLIVPAATAHLLTDRLAPMIILSMVIAAASAYLGHVSAVTVPTWFGYADTLTAGMMAVVAGGFFALAMLFAPRHGIVSRALHRLSVSLRIVGEDIVALLYRLEEFEVDEPARQTMARLHDALHLPAWVITLGVRGRIRAGDVDRSNGALRLSESGRTRGATLVRAHRLWEAYLEKHLDVPVDHLHRPAMQLEHVTDARMRDRLAADVEHPTTDPHGKRIPREDEARDRAPEGPGDESTS